MWRGTCPGRFEIEGVPLTSQDAVGSLLYSVGALVSRGALNPGQANGLTAKLTAVIESLNQGSTTDACNQLAAFVNQMNGLVRAHKLTPEAAQDLSYTMGVVRTMTGCSG